MGLLGDVKLFEDLKDRRFAQFFVLYCVVAWTVLQIFDQLADRGVLPELAYRIVLTLAASGLPGALIITWFHGEKGHQKMPRIEKWLLTGVALLAIGTTGFVIRAETLPAGGEVVAGTLALAPWEDPTRLAVLYFDAPGAGEDADFIASGLTTGLIDELSTVESLHVVSRSGSELFRGSAASSDSIGRALRVGTLVDGRIAMAGDRVRVEVSLVESSSGRQIASTRIERPRADLFDLQDELAAQVALFLRERIGVEVRDLEVRWGTTVLEAWELMQQADQVARGVTELAALGDVRGASELLTQADSLVAAAESLDPDWIYAPVRRGWLAYEQARLWGLERAPQEEWTARGLEHAERALRLDSSDPDALELRGTIRYWRYLLNLAGSSAEAQDLFNRAESDLRASVAEDPLQASAWASLSHLLLNKIDLPQAKLAAVRSYEADPFLTNTNLTLWRLASTSWELQDSFEARRWCDEGRRRFPEDFRFAQCQLMLLSLGSRPASLDTAWHHHQELVRLSPTELRELNDRKGQMLIAMALARANLADSARAVARRGRAGPDIDPLREVAWMEAIARSWMGDFDEAVRWLGVHLAANPGLVDAYREGARTGEVHWTLQGLADDPGFRGLVGLR